jgi:hypothetical protein
MEKFFLVYSKENILDQAVANSSNLSGFKKALKLLVNLSVMYKELLIIGS